MAGTNKDTLTMEQLAISPKEFTERFVKIRDEVLPNLAQAIENDFEANQVRKFNMTDPKTGIHEPMVTIPIGMDCRSDPDTWCINVDRRHERGCMRRYGAVSYTWLYHKDCHCHKGSK